jgi:hypothetical protein
MRTETIVLSERPKGMLPCPHRGYGCESTENSVNPNSGICHSCERIFKINYQGAKVNA